MSEKKYSRPHSCQLSGWQIILKGLTSWYLMPVGFFPELIAILNKNGQLNVFREHYFF